MKIVTGNGKRERITLGTFLGKGGEGIVYDVVEFSGCVAKIYSGGQQEAAARRRKIETMLARPPEKRSIDADGRQLPLLAWPTHVVEEDDGKLAGFLMPKVMTADRQGPAVSLFTYMNRRSIVEALTPDDRSLPRRLLVCRNLAGVMADLHRQGHYVADIKPQNVSIFRNTGIPCFFDTDGFSIAAREGMLFPSLVCTPDYTCPELQMNEGGDRGVVNDLQDRFALAVLMFQLLNKGIHPFQGVPGAEREQITRAQAICEGLYAYGLVANDAMRPTPGSAHDCLPLPTRKLFDRAFQGAPGARPTATEWKEHLDGLLKPGRSAFAKCRQKPDDVLHIHFAQLPCPECHHDEAQVKAADVPTAPPASSGARKSGPGAAPAAAAPSRRRKIVTTLVLLAAAMLMLAWINGWLGASPSVGYGPSGSGAPVVAGTVARPAPEPPPPEPGDAAAALAMQTATDTAGLRSRHAILLQAIHDAVKANGEEMHDLIRRAMAGEDDIATRAGTAMRDTRFADQFEGWQRFIKDARDANTHNLETFRNNVQHALQDQWSALALNPYDREIAGNLGYILVRAGEAPLAASVGIYALSLPRKPGDTQRLADWHLVGTALTLSGRTDAGLGAYAVALALTSRPDRFCDSLLLQQADFGEALKAPVEQVFHRVARKVPLVPSECSLPVQWRDRR